MSTLALSALAGGTMTVVMQLGSSRCASSLLMYGALVTPAARPRWVPRTMRASCRTAVRSDAPNLKFPRVPLW